MPRIRAAVVGALVVGSIPVSLALPAAPALASADPFSLLSPAEALVVATSDDGATLLVRNWARAVTTVTRTSPNPEYDGVVAQSAVLSGDGHTVVLATTSKLTADDDDFAIDIYRRVDNGPYEYVTPASPMRPCT